MRSLLLVLDSVGIGGAPDAASYGDEGANTLGHIFEHVPGLRLPQLDSLGLNNLLCGDNTPTRASFGRMQERSAGKDTTTGHWELAGALLNEPFATFEEFPEGLVRQIEQAADIKFIGNCARSGTEILNELGAEHLRTGRPILYTSADSVLQIAAHEEVISVERLYTLCKAARKVADTYRIGRVIARSFPTGSNREGMERIAELWEAETDGFLFANMVDFDMLFGHRRDVRGYADAPARIRRVARYFLPRVLPNDFVIITADHGNDPTFHGSDHTREEVPLFVLHRNESRALGTRKSFADVAATLSEFFELAKPWAVGQSFLR